MARLRGAVVTLVVLGACCCGAAGQTAREMIVLTKDGKTSWSIALVGDPASGFIMQRASQVIADIMARWGDARPAVEAIDDPAKHLPPRPTIVLATLEQLRQMLPGVQDSNEAIGRTAFLDEQGFAIIPLDDHGVSRLLIVSRSARGVYNGAQYLADFLIDGPRSELRTPARTLIRSPWMAGRAVYLLTIWRNECQYTADDWAKVFDSFARDGMDRVYFWMSGHFPSSKFPQTYKVVNMDGQQICDRTDQTRIGTVQDLRSIIEHAHNRGLRLYIGGGLGGWCGTRFITNSQPQTMKSGSATHSLCPSHPLVRQSLIEYYTEMFDALPRADGVYIESADEDGACQCPTCNQVIDEHGSRQFGQAQLSLLRQIAASIWRAHPHARFAYSIGYSEHAREPAYYQLVRQMSSDPRFEWMEARGSWTYPGPGGVELPPSSFSAQVMRWHPYEVLRLDAMIEIANRAARTGFYGMIADFSPGFDSGSFYEQIPFPTDLLPYVLTGFMFREVTWNPTLTDEQARQLVRDRFFGAEAPELLVQDLLSLRELMRELREHRPSDVEATAKALKTLDLIQQRIDRTRSCAWPKTVDTLNLMQRAIDDARAHVSR
ncbi:DUF4838 domain-containing protein [Fontivita pretiosa]|uniref:DUF4838 domain-containing protein n=1 Tax=Fontivita pretiosa TaxID=2989684 RepID=UPI003D172CDA